MRRASAVTEQYTREADLAHREYVSNLLLRQASEEREARTRLRLAEESKDRLMSRLAGLDLGLISSETQIMDRVIYTVNSLCMTQEGRVQFDSDLNDMDPEAMVILELVGWCRSAYPFRSVLPSYERFVRRARISLRDRLGVASADRMLRGLP